MKEKTICYLTKELARAKKSLEDANTRPNCPAEQIINLNNKIRMFDSLLCLVEKCW